MCRYWRRGIECHLWASDLSADQQRNQHRSSEQTTRDHAEKTDVPIVVSHFTLLHNNSSCKKRFLRYERNGMLA